MCSWISGVVVKSVKGPVACVERVGNDIVVKVRFDAQNEEVAAWKLLSKAKKLFMSQRAERFVGLCYGARLICEECVQAGTEPPEDFEWDVNTPTDVALPCGHIFHLGVDDDDDAKDDDNDIVRLAPPVVLIITTAPAEMAAVLDRLEKVPEGYPKAIGSIPVKIGKLGGRVVVVCKTEQDILRTYGIVFQLLQSDYLNASVKLVFAVGFAWGAQPASQGGDQRIGDVIVATKVVEAGHTRTKTPARSPILKLAAVGAAIAAVALGSAMAFAVTFVVVAAALVVTSVTRDEIRGPVRVSTLADSVNDLPCREWPGQSQGERLPHHRPTAHVGTVISLPMLLDDTKVTKRLIGHPQVVPHKPIVGGEMELYQIARAADAAGKRWLLAKGICDFAGLDGAKDKKGQPVAARAAVDFAVWILGQEVMAFFLDSN